MQKYVDLVDLVNSFPTSIYLQNLASIQPRTSALKFARSPRTDPPGPGGREGSRAAVFDFGAILSTLLSPERIIQIRIEKR